MKTETLSPLSTEEEKENRRKLVCALAQLICIVQQPTAVSAKDVIPKGAEVITLILERWPDIVPEPLEPPFNVPEALAWASGSLIEEVLHPRKEKEAKKMAAFVQDVIVCFVFLCGGVTDLRKELARICPAFRNAEEGE